MTESPDYQRGYNDAMAEAGRNLAHQMASAKTEIVDCPRCLSACGWCGDYRHMHGPDGGLLKLPGLRKRCTVLKNEDNPCPVCNGTLKVRSTTIVNPLESTERRTTAATKR